MTLEEAALGTIARHALLPPGATVICAVSGGADSMALLTFLCAQRARLGISVEVAHLHHGLAEALSDEAEAHVRATAQRLGLRLHVRHRDVGRFALRTALGIEAAGRRLRQRWFERLARTGAWIATAHTADDQAETVLMRVMRGTGTQGLRGILPRLGHVVRPFLAVRRAQVRDYVMRQRIALVEDPTNTDPGYNLRNRLRAQLIPQLVRDYNPALVEALCRLADAARADSEVLDAASAAVWLEVAGGPPAGGASEIVLPPHISDHPLAVRMRLYRRALAKCGAEDPDAAALARVDDLLRGRPGRNTVVAPGVAVRRSGRGLQFGPPPEVRAIGDAVALPVPGEVSVAGWIVRALRLNGSGRTSARLDNVVDGYRRALREPWQATVRAVDRLQVRGRIAGDRWQPPRGSGTCKLKATLNAWRVPVEERDTVPIVVRDGELVCLPGWGVDERYRPADDARETVQIEIFYEEP